MTIKLRLVAGVVALLCVATVVIGTVAIGAVTATMTNRVDDQLREFLGQRVFDEDTFSVRQDTDQPLYEPMAILMIATNGRIDVRVRAGYVDHPLPTPSLPGTLPEPGEYVTVSSVDGTMEYRIATRRVVRLEEPGQVQTLVAAIPMTEVTDTRDDLVVVMVVTVAAVLLVGGAVAWWITRRGLKPVDDMIDDAAAIAGGDLGRRVAVSDAHTEMGRLGTALNTMMGKLTSAVTQRDAEKAKLQQFVADASHELRTPLAAISGYAQLYQSGGTPPGPALDRAMSRIRGESERMARLVGDLLLLARLDDRQTGGERERIDLRLIVRDAVADAQAVDEMRPIELDAPGTVAADGNADQLQQVITNLLGNVRVHTPPGTRVTVRVRRTANGEAEISVSDNGPGIAAEHHERIFDRFYRADNSRSRDTGGTGLGLSIVASIARSHGGRATLDSTPGQGTKVTIHLPSVTEQPATGAD